MPTPINTNPQNPNSNNKEYDIHKRILNFVVDVLNLLRLLPKTVQNLNIINQISRSATSIGANDQEADGSTSRKQFYNSLTIAKKETKETNYWLNVIQATNPAFQTRMKDIISEGREIEAIISSIVQKGRSQ